MGDKCNQNGFKESVCIHTDKVYDSCRDKDCLENIRVYLTANGQSIVDRAINVKCTKAEIIWVFSDVDRSKYNFLKTHTDEYTKITETRIIRVSVIDSFKKILQELFLPCQE